ncbi:amino acid permease [Patescibacteria group bacterium]|nr:amino acid permease [Patescibacteria group bacterium]
MKSKLFSAVAIYTGTVVGAGIFGIPYVIAKIGFIPGVIYLVVLGTIVTIKMLCYGEVVSRTKEFHQTTGYAEKYLGKWGKYAISFSLFFGLYGSLLAYMIGVGDFLYTILGDMLGGTPMLYSLLFFVLASLAILAGLGMIIRVEKVMFIALFIVISLFFVFGGKHIDLENLRTFDFSHAFLPYGVLFFAFTGLSAIPDMSRMLKKEKHNFKKALLIGTVTVFFIYLCFTFIIVGISGAGTSPEAVVGLVGLLGKKIVIVGSVFGVLAMATSFLTLGLAMKEIYRYDYGLDKTLGWVLTCFVPLIIFLLGLVSFIGVLGAVGSVTGGISGIMILWMYLRAKKKGDQEPAYVIKVPKPVIYILSVIFALGALYEVYYLFVT